MRWIGFLLTRWIDLCLCKDHNLVLEFSKAPLSTLHLMRQFLRYVLFHQSKRGHSARIERPKSKFIIFNTIFVWRWLV